MSLNHKVEDIQLLLDDAKNLLKNVTNGQTSSAYSIIQDLTSAYDILTSCWKGTDAGVQINNIVHVHNEMVLFRQKMAEMAIAAYQVGIYYREIQSANGSSVEIPSPLSDDVVVATKAEYKDNTDTVNITEIAIEGKNKLNNATKTFEELKNLFGSAKDSIFNNWLAGDKRSEYEDFFANFNTKFTNYEEMLNNIAENITQALRNYGG